MVFNIPKNKCCGYLLESPRLGEAILTNIHKICSLEERDPLLALILPLLGFFVQRQMVYNVKHWGTNTVIITRVFCLSVIVLHIPRQTFFVERKVYYLLENMEKLQIPF